MPYVLSVGLLALAVILLVSMLVVTWRSVRRSLRAFNDARGDVRDRVGMLRARWAALRVAIAERRG